MSRLPTTVSLAIVVFPLLYAYNRLDLSWAVQAALCLATVLLFKARRSLYAGRELARDRARLGASTIPKVRGRLPGNIDILWRLVALESTEYCGDTLRQWEKEYGPTFDMGILWGHQIVTSDPVNIHEIFTTRFASFQKSKKFHDMMEAFLGDSIFTTDGDAWRYHRALARPFFAHERTSHLDLFERHTEKDLFTRFTMDTITEMLFGNCVNSLQSNSSSDDYSAFILAYNTLQKISVQRLSLNSSQRFELAVVRIVKAIERKDSLFNAKSEGTFLDYLVQENPGGYLSLISYDCCMMLNPTSDPTFMRDSLISFLVAGRDSTASLLTFAAYALALYPEVLTTLQNEIEEVVGTQSPPTLDGIKRMNTSCFERDPPLVPANTYEYTKSSRANNFNIPTVESGAYVYAGGRQCFLRVFANAKTKDIWGADAEEFRPERWLVDDMEDKDKSLEHGIRFMPFNAGPRTCLGQTFAYHKCSYLLIRLLQHFNAFSFAPDAQPEDSLPPEEWKSMVGRQALEKFALTAAHSLKVAPTASEQAVMPSDAPKFSYVAMTTTSTADGAVFLSRNASILVSCGSVHLPTLSIGLSVSPQQRLTIDASKPRPKVGAKTLQLPGMGRKFELTVAAAPELRLVALTNLPPRANVGCPFQLEVRSLASCERVPGMEGAAKRKARWIYQFLVVFTARKPQKAKNNVLAETPSQGISMNAIGSAEKVLEAIPLSGAREGIGAFLSVIKEIHFTPALKKETLKALERNVRLLVELLEPLAYIERHLFPADLEHQLRRLSRRVSNYCMEFLGNCRLTKSLESIVYRELRTISQTMIQSISSAAARRRSNRNENTGGNVVIFARDFSLFLDRFRLIALPMYTISTMEAAMRPLGIVSNSSCGLLSFINWIRTARDIDYRFGLIQTVRICYRKYKVVKPQHRHHIYAPSCDDPVDQGTVVFAPTCEALVRGAAKSHRILVIQQAHSLVDLVMRIEDAQVARSDLYPLFRIYDRLWSYGRLAAGHPTDQLYADYEGHNVWAAWHIADDTIRREV
ncbi:hypothetical protein BS47DRAFT_1393957 [Hydnum rufescens UP504]|uniref:Cytochrome P450 n=1 Tax=Hydnum rufescens UP504 TaxID=1448309 RepID=A0A9P6AVN0_9AGAM|nr:hypothetical protein BS47DRAFT_1393957 [Hydnum rufescens UP504]